MCVFSWWERYKEGQRARREKEYAALRRARVNEAMLAARHFRAGSCRIGELFSLVFQHKCFSDEEMARVTFFLLSRCRRGLLPEVTPEELVSIVAFELERLEEKWEQKRQERV